MDSRRKSTDKKPTIVAKKELNLSAGAQSLWLMKIPQGVYDSWSTKSHGEVLGTLSVTTSSSSTAPADKKIIIHLSDDSERNKLDVTDYELDELSGGVELMPFVHNEEDGSFSLKGAITKNCSLKPKGDFKYRESIRARTENASKKIQSVKQIDNDEAFNSQMNIGIVDFIPPHSVQAKRRALEQRTTTAKRIKSAAGSTEGSGKDIRSKIFQAFEAKELYTLKELANFCQSPEKDVKDVIKDYTNFHSKGLYRNFYELRMEYKSTLPSVS
eukprot:gene1172-2276_t